MVTDEGEDGAVGGGGGGAFSIKQLFGYCLRLFSYGEPLLGLEGLCVCVCVGGGGDQCFKTSSELMYSVPSLCAS